MKFIKHSLIVNEEGVFKSKLTRTDIRRGMLLQLVKELSDDQIEGIGHFEVRSIELEEYPGDTNLKKYILTVQDNIIQQTCSLN